MKFLNKMERKFGRYAIHNLMYYIVILQVVGIVISTFAGPFANAYLYLDIAKVLEGQVWRLFTFIITGNSISGDPINLIFTAITLYFYYFLGRSLENAWGAFRFNMYYLSGILLNIIAAFIMYFALGGISIPFVYGLTYVNYSLFLAAAVMFPDTQIYISFLFPIKMKYLGIIYGISIALTVVQGILAGSLAGILIATTIIVALLNFLIFFFCTRNYKRISPKQIKRKSVYRSQVRNVEKSTRHQCAVCGRTEQDDENLDFRYCSKCDGNYEYCSDHLFTHQHIKRH